MERRTTRIIMKTFPSLKEKASLKAKSEGRTLSNYIENLIRRDLEGDEEMIIIERSNDKETWFDDLAKAKAYMIPTEELTEEDYLGDDFEGYAKTFEEYKAELRDAESLEGLAEVWNKYTDMFNDGSEFKVKEIK